MVAGTNGTQQPGGSPPPQPGDKRRISAICCEVAPPVLEFDPAGNLVSRGAGRARATSGRRRCTASPSTAKTTSGSPTNQGHQMLKFTRQGKFLLQIGKKARAKATPTPRI